MFMLPPFVHTILSTPLRVNGAGQNIFDTPLWHIRYVCNYFRIDISVTKISLDTGPPLSHDKGMSDTATEERRDVEGEEEQLVLREIIEGRESFGEAFNAWVEDMEITFGGAK